MVLILRPPKKHCEVAVFILMMTQASMLIVKMCDMSCFNQGHPIVFEFKSKTKRFNVTVKTRKRCINISVLLWQHVLVLLDQCFSTAGPRPGTRPWHQ
jgi:hypothetical protein